MARELILEAKTREMHFKKQKMGKVYQLLIGFKRVLQERQLSQKDLANLQAQMRENNESRIWGPWNVG